jgi:hypothetical protein
MNISRTFGELSKYQDIEDKKSLLRTHEVGVLNSIYV